MQNDGSLQAVATLSASENLWVSAPTCLEVSVVDGRTFLIMAAAGTNSLTVVEVNVLGGMRVVDHVLDNLNTRFNNVQAMDTVRFGELTYVVAGGSDGGVTVFLLLPDGHLIEQGTMVDTAQSSLANVSAIEAQATGSGLAIFVTSASEIGVTRLQYDLGAAGSVYSGSDGSDVLTGGNQTDILDGGDGSDVLSGGGGNDVLSDGAGNDTLTGGSGADTFVFSRDGDTDTIIDFDPLNDRIDLSQWYGLRGASQLEIATLADGFQLVFGDETLLVRSSNWGSNTISTLPETALIGVDRISMVPEPIPNNSTPDVSPYQESGTPNDDRMIAPNRNSILRGRAGDDQIVGGNGTDELYGGDGNDTLISGGGMGNIIYGDAGNDTIYVGAIWDLDL